VKQRRRRTELTRKRRPVGGITRGHNLREKSGGDTETKATAPGAREKPKGSKKSEKSNKTHTGSPGKGKKKKSIDPQIG